MNTRTTVHLGGFVKNSVPANERLGSVAARSSAVSEGKGPQPAANGAPRVSDDVMFIRLPEVKAVTGLSKTSIYQLIRGKSFPAPVRLGPRTVAWVKSEIREWAVERVRASRSAA